MSEWISRNTSLNGRPFSYKEREFQIQIADDMHPALVCKKCSQVGLSEIQIRKFLGWLLRNRGTRGIFTLPDEKMFKRLSKDRVKPIIESDKVFNIGDEQGSRSMGLYQIGGSTAYFTGMTEGDATSIPADILSHDELDLSKQRMIGLFQSRLQGSRHRITHKFSTPTLPGFGIDAAYDVSDQHVFMVKCDCCGHWQDPKLKPAFLQLKGYKGPERYHEASIEELTQIDWSQSFLRCENSKCARPLNLTNPEMRQWVAAHPGRLLRGYFVSPFSSSFIGIDYIFGQLIERRNLGDLQGWFNTVLGETYMDAAAQLTLDELRAVMVSPNAWSPPGGAPVFVGIDVGDTCHLVLGAQVGKVMVAFSFEQVPASRIVERVGEILATYNVRGGAIDRFPYTPTANQIRDLSSNRIMPTEYRGQTTINVITDEFDDLSHAQVNRTKMLDDLVGSVRARTTEWRGYAGLGPIVETHMQNMVRQVRPELPANWVKLNENDHFFHALAFLNISPRLADVVDTMGPEAETRMVASFMPVNEISRVPMLTNPLGVQKHHRFSHNPLLMGR